MNTSNKETSALKLYTQVLSRRRFEFLATVTLIFLVMLLSTLRQKKIYESSLLLLIGKEQKPQVVDREQSKNENDTIDELSTQIQVLQTLPIISKATDSLRANYPELEPRAVANNLSLKQLSKSGIISVSYRDTDPERLVKVLTQLGETYVNFSLVNRKSQVTSAITFIETKLPSAQRDLDEQSQQLARFRRQNNLTDPSKVGETLSTALAALNQEEYTTIAALRQGQALYTLIEQRLGLLPPDRALAVASLSQDEIYRGLLKDYQEAEKLYALELLRFTDKAPQTQLLKDKRDELKRLLAEHVQQILGKNASSIDSQRLNELQIAQVSQLLEAENTLRVQQARLSALQSIRSNLEGKFKLVPDLQQEYDSLSRNVKVASDNVTLLLTKLEEFRILEAQESAIWKVVQAPYPPGKPVSPNLKQSLMVGLALGIVLGGIVVYVREQLDRRLRDSDSVSGLLDLQILATLPKIDAVFLQTAQFPLDGTLIESISDINLRQQWISFQSAIQNLLLNLKAMGVTHSLKVLGFTSSTFGEGKSTIVKHLGIGAAELGYRVLLIDADLRKPELHLGWEIDNQPGLSSVVNSDFSWRDLIHETQQTGLHLLPAGAVSSNPLVLLNSPKTKQLLIDVQNHYDFILVDMPPFNGLPDSLAIASLLDGLVLLVGLELTTQEDLKVSVNYLNHAQTSVVGIVCNMAKNSEMTDSSNPSSSYSVDKPPHRFSINQ